MSYTITGKDKTLVLQNVLHIRAKMEVLNSSNQVIDCIEGGVVSGSSNCDGESDIRRTFSLTIIPDIQSDLFIGESGIIWLDKKVKLYIGIMDNLSEEYTWYPQGVYLFMSSSASYDITNNQLSIECSDLMSELDGSRNGNLGQYAISLPSYTTYLSSIWIDYADAHEIDITNMEKTLAYIRSKDSPYCTDSELLLLEDTDVDTALWQLCTNYDNLTLPEIEDYEAFLNSKLLEDNPDRMITPNITVETYRRKLSSTNTYATDVCEHNIIREWILVTLSGLGKIDKDICYIDHFGEHKGMPFYEYGWDYIAYREKHPDWEDVPYDLDFESGTTVLNILTELRDLYENYEIFYDEEGNVIGQMIPSGEEDPITFDNDFLQKIIVSEDTSIDFTEVKNVEEVWGETFDPDWFVKETTQISFSDNTYSLTIPKYTDEDHDDYANGDEFAFLVSDTNEDAPYISINGLDKIQIYDENWDVPIEAGTLVAGNIYDFKISKTRDTDKKVDVLVVYLKGLWQVHTMDVLTDGTTYGYFYLISDPDVHITSTEYYELEESQRALYTPSADMYKDTTYGEYTEKYSKRFFELVYACNDVHMTVIEDSPFTIQKLGIILEVYENDDITSTSTGIETARQENFRNYRLTDSISITTKLCPFADVNIKVSYQRSDADEPYEYLVKSISHDWDSGQTTWSLIRYYKLYTRTEEEE